ncbi:MAG: hypothetical protein U0Y96_00140 [Candidatus Kapaibacterium sp.]
MNSLRLFHISQDDSIDVFMPRPSPSHFQGLSQDCVFAITDELQANYFFPRDCPRICIRIGSATTTNDAAEFFAHSIATSIIAIEHSWFETLCTTSLVQYEFDTTNFTELDANAGYYISTKPEVPKVKRLLHNIPELLFRHNVELRIVPRLWKLQEAVVQSTLQFSCIRMRNAQR